MRWKNARPSTNSDPYEPTLPEQIANVLTHGVFIFPFIAWVVELLQKTPYGMKTYVLLYSLATVSLFLVSTVFHVICLWNRKSFLCHLFHRGDRAMIFLFIGGSYSPWLSLSIIRDQPIHMELRNGIIIWTLFGILFQQLFHEQHKLVETSLYFVVALIPALFLFDSVGWLTLLDLGLGGTFYAAGVIFFKLDGILPFAHAVWHIFVICGALIHLNAVQDRILIEE